MRRSIWILPGIRISWNSRRHHHHHHHGPARAPKERPIPWYVDAYDGDSVTFRKTLSSERMTIPRKRILMVTPVAGQFDMTTADGVMYRISPGNRPSKRAICADALGVTMLYANPKHLPKPVDPYAGMGGNYIPPTQAWTQPDQTQGWDGPTRRRS